MLQIYYLYATIRWHVFRLYAKAQTIRHHSVAGIRLRLNATTQRRVQELQVASHLALALVFRDLAVRRLEAERRVTLHLERLNLRVAGISIHHLNLHRLIANRLRAISHELHEIRLRLLAVATPVGVEHCEGRHIRCRPAALETLLESRKQVRILPEDNQDDNDNDGDNGEGDEHILPIEPGHLDILIFNRQKKLRLFITHVPSFQDSRGA